MNWLDALADSAATSLGFFWKAGWAFVLGYAISALIQAFVPKAGLTRLMGSPSVRSVGVATGFGAISSSCSFAALAAARALLRKGAHFIAAVAFMFASTNLVIELGVLIYIFLGWEYLAAEIIGGLILITLSTLLIRLTYPQEWIAAAKEKLGASDEDDAFDWRERVRSREGWRLVGQRFGGEWGMVWQEITIGFTVAGLVKTLVPDSFWQALFLSEQAAENPGNFLVALENALVAPFVAAATFIGSMGNIPLATVLASSGVLFAGIMGFIYSDLMVPPLVKVNARYYGWRVALYIAAVMYAAIVATALLLHYGFLALGWTPESQRAIGDVTRFAIDYTFWMNLGAVAVVATMVWLAIAGRKKSDEDGHGGHDSHDHDHGGSSIGVQDVVTWLCIAMLVTGAIASLAGAGAG